MDNYFNYFTEIEQYYQSKRETFTLLSTLDWVLIENWKDGGIPLEIVLRGIDRAFAKKTKRRINSLAYCTGAVNEVLEEQKDLRTEAPAPPEFAADEVRRYLDQLADAVSGLTSEFNEFAPRIGSIAEAIRAIDVSDLRAGESSLNAMEEKLTSIIEIGADEAVLIEVRKEVDSNLAAVRSRMTVEQIAMLEQQLWKRKLMERFNVPRLSLFYLI
jgi:hypothetical protein